MVCGVSGDFREAVPVPDPAVPPRIGAALSGDSAMTDAYRSGDSYLGFAVHSGPHDPATSPGMDRDDQDASVYPGNGC